MIRVQNRQYGVNRLSIVIILTYALLIFLFNALPVVHAAEVDPYLSQLSESPGNAAGNLALIRKAVEKANREKTGHLVFPPGVYEVGDEKSREHMERLMSGEHHPYTPFEDYNVAMNFSGVEGLVVDGQGCTLMFFGLIQPFEIFECGNVVIKNIVIDWKRPLFSEGVVRLVKNTLLDIDIFPEFPVHGGEPVVSFQNLSLDTGRLSGVSQFSNITNCELVAPQTVRIHSPQSKYVTTGDIITIRHIYTYRHGIHLNYSNNIRIQDVTIHALPGMGIFGTRSRDITIKRYTVRPSGRRIMSDNVDAIHLVSCSGTVTVDNCYFQGMGDDAFNMHGRYYTIGEVLDDRTVLLIEQNEQMYPNAGDTIEFVRKNTLYSYAEAVIRYVTVDKDTGETVIVLDRPLPDGFDTTDCIANLAHHAKLRFTNNTVRDIRGRALLVQTRDALIENNMFEHLTGQGVHVDTAFPTWNESVGTRNIVIRGNTFLDCGFGFTNYCSATGILVETECEEPRIGVHRNLTIENNLIIGHKKPALYLSCLDGAVVRGNRIITDGVAAWLEYAVNITFENNNFDIHDVIIGPGCENRAIKKFRNKENE